MGQYSSPPDFPDEFRKLVKRVQDLEIRASNPLPPYTTSTRPDPTTVAGLVIRNLTTTKAEYSDGALWQPLY